MSEQDEKSRMFPEFERYAEEIGLSAKAKGGLSAKLPRILGQGSTKAKGLALPPAPIERKLELAGLVLPAELFVPESVKAEIKRVGDEANREINALGLQVGMDRFCAQVMNQIPEPKGFRDNRYFSKGLVLHHERKGMTFAWGITTYHPIIDRIPPDVEYVIQAHQEAEELLEKLEQPPDRFEKQLDLAWDLASHFAEPEGVLIRDVARLYMVAGQTEKFWKNPERKYFVDLPPAAFVANLRLWLRSRGSEPQRYEFVPATLTQEKKAFYLPSNAEGTQAKPYIAIKRKK